MLNTIYNLIAQKKLKKFNCKLTSDITKIPKNVEIICESNVKVGGNVLIDGNLSIGAHSYMRSVGELHGTVNIGRFCSIANDVIVGLNKNQHPSDWLSTSLFSDDLEKKYLLSNLQASTSIGHDCWIGRGALIFSGLTVGTGAIVAAKSVVTKNVPPYAIVAGIPATIIKYRFEKNTIESLTKSRMWNFSIADLSTLELNDPTKCLERFEFFKSTNYKKLIIKNKKVKVIE